MADNYRFGRLEIRPAERQALIDGHPAALGARAFDLLLTLIEHDRVVTRNELYDRVWEGRVVEDNNLAVQVHALRKVLGERAVITVPGRGYRFGLASQKRSEEPALVAAPSSRQSLQAPSLLLGREEELSALEHLLAQHRLVTVSGAGGIGKTVVALAAAHVRAAAERDGVAWVDLAPINDPTLLPSAVAQALGLPTSGGADPLSALLGLLEPMQVLLVLDNAEHLIDAVARLAAAVLGRTPGLRLLVTSQAALRIDGERVFRLDPLAVPETGTTAVNAAHYGAVALFVEQAQAADRRFVLNDGNVGTVIGLCARLDGLPLALKLAAARLPLLGLRGLETKLAERLQVIGGGRRNAPTRQQTLRAALDWSHSLLSDTEQVVFRRLGIFVGSFSLEAAVGVAGDAGLDPCDVVDALASLVERSFVVADDSDLPRYRFLETPREYALLRLAQADETALVQRRHARVIADIVIVLQRRWWEVPDDEVIPPFAAELDNVRAALDWAVEHDGVLAVEIMGACNNLLTLVDLTHEAHERASRIDGFVGADIDRSIAAGYWQWRARCHAGVDHAQMHSSAAKAEALFRQLGDKRGIYAALALQLASGQFPPEEADAAVTELVSLERMDWPPRLRALGHAGQGMVCHLQDRYADAAERYDLASALTASSGARCLHSVYSGLAALAHYALGDVERSVELFRKAVLKERPRRFGFFRLELGFLAVGLVLQGNLAEARQTMLELFRLCRASEWYLFDLFSDAYVALAVAEGRDPVAARLLGFADRSAERCNLRALDRQRIDQIRTTLAARLDVKTLQQLTTQGRGADQEAVCRWTLQLNEDEADTP